MARSRRASSVLLGKRKGDAPRSVRMFERDASPLRPLRSPLRPPFRPRKARPRDERHQVRGPGLAPTPEPPMRGANPSTRASFSRGSGYNRFIDSGGRAMPVHDWTRVNAGIFHDFHHDWITMLKRALNAGRLPAGYYALAEQIAGGLGPDVPTLDFTLPGPPRRRAARRPPPRLLSASPWRPPLRRSASPPPPRWTCTRAGGTGSSFATAADTMWWP
jgi:hypothetical protein